MAEDGGAAGLEQYCLLAKTAKGRACVALIQKVMADKKIFVFGELLAMPNVQGLRGTEHEPYLRLLELFAYGVYGDHKAAGGALPQLSDAMTEKLRMLTVVALANTSRVVPYGKLQEALGVSSVRVVEDVVLDAMYAGLLQCRLDQRAGTLRVQHVTPRDVRPEEIDSMIATLDMWAGATDRALRGLRKGVNSAKAAWKAEEVQQRNIRDRADELRRTVKPQRGGGRSQHGARGGGGGDDDDDAFGDFDGAMETGGGRSRPYPRAKRRGPAMFDARPRNK